jgi:hypothetical protein
MSNPCSPANCRRGSGYTNRTCEAGFKGSRLATNRTRRDRSPVRVLTPRRRFERAASLPLDERGELERVRRIELRS